MTTDSATAEAYGRLQKDAKDRAAALIRIHAAMKMIPAQFAIAKKNADALEIEAVQSAVTAEISAIEDQLMNIKISLEDIHQVEQDRQFIVAHLADFRTLVQHVSDDRKDLLKQLDEARNLKAQAATALAAQQNTQDDAFADLAVLEKRVDAFAKMAKVLADCRNLLELANSSVGNRDAKGLAQLQQTAKHTGVCASYPTLTRIEADVDALLDKFRKKGLEGAVMKKIEQQAKDIQVSAATARQAMKQIDEVLAKVDALEVADIDFGKAGKALGITDKAQLAELDKILRGNFDEVEKKLDALGQRLSPKAKGKAMLAQLQKARVL